MAALKFAGALFWFLAIWIFWSVRAAWRLFRPKIVGHPTLELASWGRTAIGLVASLVVLMRYDALDWYVPFDAVVKAGLVSVAATPALIGAMIFLVARARTGRRELVYRLARGPGVARLIWTVAVIVCINGLVPAFEAVSNTTLLLIGAYLLGLWILCFTLAGTVQVYRFVFNASDGHPLLPALTTPAFAILALLYELAVIDPQPDVPQAIAVTVSALAVACALALSWWEFHFVSRIYGITTRSGTPAIDVDSQTGQSFWKVQSSVVNDT